MKPRKILVTGYYGGGNLGDEALRLALLGALRKAAKLKPVILAGAERCRPLTILRELRRSAALVLGGGGLLQNKTSNRSLFYYLGLITLARVVHRPAFLIGQGLGPIDGWLARRLTRFSLGKVRYLGVRDKGSLTLAEEIGLNAQLESDLFFLLPPLPEKRTRNNPPRIGISLTGRATASKFEEWKEFLATLNAETALIFLPFFPREDLPLAKRLSQWLPGATVNVPDSVGEAQSLIANMDLIVSSRLHPLEFALRAGTPMLAILSDPKIEGFTAAVRDCGGPVIPAAPLPRLEEPLSLLRDPPSPAELTAAYRKLHRRAEAGFNRFLDELAQAIGDEDG